MENNLVSERLQVERKQFFFDVKENPRGRFLKITEDVNGRRDAIIIPAPGLADFARVLSELASQVEPGQSDYPQEHEAQKAA